MSTWVAIVAVGVASYLFRVAPLLVLGRVNIGERADRLIRHAGAAALTALLVGSLQHGSGGAGSQAALVAATAVGLVLAVRGSSMLRVVLAGGAVYATMAAVVGLVS